MGPRHARRTVLRGSAAWLVLVLILWWGRSPLGHAEPRRALATQAGSRGGPGPAWSPVAQPEISALPGIPRVLLDEPGVNFVVRLGSRGPSS